MLLFCLGLLPYIYLPIAGRLPPPGSWGAVDTRDGFLRHVLRQEYGSLQVPSLCLYHAVWLPPGPLFLLGRLATCLTTLGGLLQGGSRIKHPAFLPHGA